MVEAYVNDVARRMPRATSDEAVKFWIFVVLAIVVLSTIPKMRRVARGQ